MDVRNLSADAEEFTANAYLVDDTALIDAGADPVVVEALAGKDVETVVVTHSHWDHVENLPAIVERHGPDVYAPDPEQLSVDADVIEDGDELTLGAQDAVFTVYATPGHKDDHVCLFNADEGVLFAGDLLFPNGGFGRTDLDEGDREILIESIERMTHLDVKALYAGHQEPTTENVNQQILDSLAEARKKEPKYPDEQ